VSHYHSETVLQTTLKSQWWHTGVEYPTSSKQDGIATGPSAAGAHDRLRAQDRLSDPPEFYTGTQRPSEHGRPRQLVQCEGIEWKFAGRDLLMQNVTPFGRPKLPRVLLGSTPSLTEPIAKGIKAVLTGGNLTSPGGGHNRADVVTSSKVSPDSGDQMRLPGRSRWQRGERV